MAYFKGRFVTFEECKSRSLFVTINPSTYTPENYGNSSPLTENRPFVPKGRAVAFQTSIFKGKLPHFVLGRAAPLLVWYDIGLRSPLGWLSYDPLRSLRPLHPNPLEKYCWWKKSEEIRRTSWYGKSSNICRVSCMLGGAGFLPSTVSIVEL